MRHSDITILIAARNAASTIGRAIDSVTASCDCPILLVDDFSSDATLAVAEQQAGDRLRWIRPPFYGPLGLTRRAGLDAVDTPMVMVLDADDALLPGRIDRALHALQSGDHDVFVDGLTLHDGRTGDLLKTMPVPDFLRRCAVPVRLFERNYLPGIGQIALRTRLARRIGYDASLHGAEDVDLVLRMVAAGARFHYDTTPGYAMYTRQGSVSRDLDRQRFMYRRSLGKFAYEQVKALHLEQGYSERIAAWALVSMATYRAEYAHALTFIDEIDAMACGSDTILEPEGPYPFTEGWRTAFHRGTLLGLSGEHRQSARLLQKAYAEQPTPEVCNNLAVAIGRSGDVRRRTALLQQALAGYPDYVDAQRNTADTHSMAYTTHPLRRQPARQDYD